MSAARPVGPRRLLTNAIAFSRFRLLTGIVKPHSTVLAGIVTDSPLPGIPRPGIVMPMGESEDPPLFEAGTLDRSISAGNVTYRYDGSRFAAAAALCSYV